MSLAVVAGAIANKPFNGGASWTRLSYVLGLRAQGWDVHFVEQIAERACVDESGYSTSFEGCVNLAYFRRVTRAFGMEDAATLVLEGGSRSAGRSLAELEGLAASTDLLLNISGHLTLPCFLEEAKRRVFVDLDPGYTQCWHAAGDHRARLENHDCYFTVGENVGQPGCPIPTNGIDWRPTRPLVPLDHWDPVAPSWTGRFTTVASWRGPYGPVGVNGHSLGPKAHEFRKFVRTPKEAPFTFEVALDIHPGDERDLQLLRANGWRVVDPRDVTADPPTFRDYVRGSSAEFSTAQEIYVATGCGWFSDRTARYLACAKPAVVQDTGFSRNIPVGEGLLSFRTIEEARDAVARIAADYETHSRAARRLAEEYFDARTVLGRLLDDAEIVA